MRHPQVGTHIVGSWFDQNDAVSLDIPYSNYVVSPGIRTLVYAPWYTHPKLVRYIQIGVLSTVADFRLIAYGCQFGMRLQTMSGVP